MIKRPWAGFASISEAAVSARPFPPQRDQNQYVTCKDFHVRQQTSPSTLETLITLHHVNQQIVEISFPSCFLELRWRTNDTSCCYWWYQHTEAVSWHCSFWSILYYCRPDTLTKYASLVMLQLSVVSAVLCSFFSRDLNVFLQIWFTCSVAIMPLFGQK